MFTHKQLKALIKSSLYARVIDFLSWGLGGGGEGEETKSYNEHSTTCYLTIVR